MAKNWLAYEACEVLLTGADKEAMSEIGSRFPLFTVAVLKDGTKSLLDILKALPKVTARVVETGLKDYETEEKDVEESDETETKEEPKKEKKTSKKAKKAEKESEPEEEDDEDEELDTDKPYESMSAKELYKLCCERGISSHCKSRSKDKLIEVLEKFDNGELETSNRKKDKEEPKKTNKKAKKEESKEDDEDEWDEDEEQEESDPYKGKTAKELYKMCTDRGIKVKPKQNAEAYAKLLKKADEAENEEDEAEDEDDDWEI